MSMMESNSTGRVVSVVAEQCAHCSHGSVVPVVAIDARKQETTHEGTHVCTRDRCAYRYRVL